MKPDFQKQEAKQCLWDMDGQHTAKKSRNRGKARGKDKALIRAELNHDRDADDERLAELRREEMEAALYCHYYGPCARCESDLDGEV